MTCYQKVCPLRLARSGCGICTNGRPGRAEFINVLTGGTSGVYYPLGVALSQIYGKVLPSAKISVQATKASAENLNLLQAGRGEVPYARRRVERSVERQRGGRLQVPLTKLRTIAAIYPNYIQIVAAADSDIKTLADLKGKRISVGAPKSGTELNARDIFRGAGMTYKDFGRVEYLPFGESVELMKNRQLDATLISAGLGVAALRDLATSVKITICVIPPDVGGQDRRRGLPDRHLSRPRPTRDNRLRCRVRGRGAALSL